MAYCADLSGSDDSALSDDCDYHNFKEQVKKINKQRLKPQTNCQEQKNQDLKLLFSALLSGNVQSVVEYIDSGLDVNVNVEDGWRPLLLAASLGNPDLIKELINKGANVNLDRDGCTALMMACNCPNTTSPFEKSLEVIKQLVENGANVKEINRKRMTALMFAANNGNLKAVQYLLPLSIKNAEDNQRWT
ncbi:ankyrin repeat, SAM and basic leucine zipper domain-containing protein 1-like, partial [Anoplophora glabripennis]|uniref:ankyrin repeat, SAM and basic leucine zipper domain-containing protein 1-like n=1 Tax=Anoplophora glabripennis TaxID=217634 RepID=UPI000874C69D